MDKKTEEYIDGVTEIIETLGMKEAAEYLSKHDKTRKYIYGESEPMGRIYYSDPN